MGTQERDRVRQTGGRGGELLGKEGEGQTRSSKLAERCCHCQSICALFPCASFWHPHAEYHSLPTSILNLIPCPHTSLLTWRRRQAQLHSHSLPSFSP